MSEWITDREPTAEDSDQMGQVWVTGGDGKVNRQWWTTVSKQPWMPIEPPEPFVKAKRWEVIWDGYNNCWKVRDTTFEFGGMLCNCLRTQEHREAAERIAAIYEEVMP